jgi:hypothetical protein
LPFIVPPARISIGAGDDLNRVPGSALGVFRSTARPRIISTGETARAPDSDDATLAHR